MRCIKNSPLTQIKIPHGAYKMAVERGILPELLFYCNIKSINIQGYLKRGSVIEPIMAVTGYQPAQIRRHLEKLLSYGWIQKKKGNVWIKSYDTVWSYLGYVIDNNTPLHLLKLKPGFNIEEQIWLNEIGVNLNFQEKKAKGKQVELKIKALRNSQSNTEKSKLRKKSCDAKVSRWFSERINLEKLHKNIQCKTIRQGELPVVNYDITLSCLGVANILGFKCASKGYSIQKRLEELGMITIKRRTLFVRKQNGAFLAAPYLSNGFYISGDNIMRRLPNKITIK